MKSSQFSPEERLAIAREHMDQHDGVLEPSRFVECAESAEHPAHEYFEWDDSKAGHQHRVWQARQFVKVRINAQSDKSNGKLTIAYKEMPALISPLDTRYSGGGFIETTPELLRQNALHDGHGLISWLRTYGSALSESEVRKVQTLIRSLENPLPDAQEMPDHPVVIAHPKVNGSPVHAA